MALLKEMSGVKSTVPLVDKRSLDCVTILMTTLRSCEDKENGLNRAQVEPTLVVIVIIYY